MNQRYLQQYHPGEINRCPGCGGTHWLVGRITAECAEPRCSTPLFLRETSLSSTRFVQSDTPTRSASSLGIDI